MNDKDEALSLEQTLRLALEALELCTNQGMIPMYLNKNIDAITAIKAALLSRSDGEAKDEKQKPVNIKKVAEEHGINLPTEFVPKHDESKAAIQSLTDQCAALIWERDELQKQMWRSEKQEPVTWRYKIVDVFGRPAWTLKTPKSDTRVLESQPLYTTPPQREAKDEPWEKFCDSNCVWTDHHPDCKLPHRPWVGLTDEEIEQEFGFIDELLRDCVQRTEAKLKEKNT